MAVLIMTLALSDRLHAAVFSCPSGDVACLITAINTANENGEDDTIQLQAGTYTLTAVDNVIENDGGNGLPSITSAITITGAGADTTIIERDVNGDAFFRIFHVRAGGTLTLEALHIQKGHAATGGGGIEIRSGGTVTVENSTINDNTATGGGFRGGVGIENFGGTLTIINSTISGNRVTGGVSSRGGGIRNGLGGHSQPE